MVNKNEHIHLDQLSREFPSHVPDGYFDDLTSMVMARIGTEREPRKEMMFLRYLRPAMGLAASFLIIMALIYIPVKVLFPVKKSIDQSASLTIDEELLISYPLAEHSLFETLENTDTDDLIDDDQLETVLLASVDEYELIDLNN